MKYLFLSLSLLLSSISLSAQPFYAGFSAAYSYGMPGDVVLTSAAVGQVQIENLRAGSGISGALNAGYYLGEQHGVDLQLNYHNNMNRKFENARPDPFNLAIGSPRSTTYSIWAMRLAPTLFFHLRKRDEPGLFIKAGPLVQWSGMSILHNAVDMRMKDVYSEVDFDPNISVGATSTLGYQYPISEQLVITGSAGFNLIYYGPNRAERTTYEVGGEDRLNDLDRNQKEYEFITDGQFSPFPDDDSNEPTPVGKNWLNYSNVELRVGVKLLL